MGCSWVLSELSQVLSLTARKLGTVEASTSWCYLCRNVRRRCETVALVDTVENAGIGNPLEGLRGLLLLLGWRRAGREGRVSHLGR